MLSEEKITMLINKDLMDKRGFQQTEMGFFKMQDQHDTQKVVDPFELGAEEDLKRQFLETMRPDKRCWNFIQADDENKVPHVLRAAANPNSTYIDGRVQDLITVVEGMGVHLRLHEPDDWEHLNKMTMAIFQHENDDMHRKIEEYEKLAEEAKKK